MNRERIPGISYFEAVLHNRHKRVTLSSEIKDCFEYFEGQRRDREIFGDHPLILIHNNDLTLRRVLEGKGYSVEIGGKVRVVGVDPIPKTEQIEIVRKIRNITFPYAEHVRNRS